MKFKEYVNSVEKHIGYQIMKLNILVEEDVKVLRMTMEESTHPRSLLRSVQTREEVTVPYFPQQNGVAGQLNRTIMEGARSMLYQNYRWHFRQKPAAQQFTLTIEVPQQH